MIIPEREGTILHIVQCPKCEEFYKKPRRPAVTVACGTMHNPGDCCHYGEQKITKETVNRVLEFFGEAIWVAKE
jgi:hypothetical protein